MTETTRPPAPGAAPTPDVPDKDISSLVVVAGASCVGKTTYLRRLERGEAGGLPPALRALPLGEYRIRTAMELDPPEAGAGAGDDGKLILHYDLFRPITFHGGLSFAADPVLSVLGRAERVAVLTLWEVPEVLRARARTRRRRLWRQKLLRPPALRGFRGNWLAYRGAASRRDLMRPWFEHPDGMWRLYDEWFRFCAAAGIEDHWIASSSAPGAARHVGMRPPGAAPWRRPED